jgi:hypothetical protein
MPELVSLVVPIFNEEECLPLLRRELVRVADRIERERGLQVETVLMDDGSSDRSWVAILDFAQADLRVRAISFSRNFGHQAALTAAIRSRAATGWSRSTPTMQISIITFGCLNLLCLGIMGEYVGRIYEQSKNRPPFLVRERLELGDVRAHTRAR